MAHVLSWWKGTDITAAAARATAHTTDTLQDGAIPQVILRWLAQGFGQSVDIAQYCMAEVIWIMAVASIPVFFWIAHWQSQQLADSEYADQVRLDAWTRIWDARDWHVLIGLSELYTHGLIPWGPWENESVRERWPDKRYLQRLLRRGIIPLAIQDGGVSTRQTKLFRFSPQITLPQYLQTKKRAYFQFMVPYPDGHRDSPLAALERERSKFIIAILKNPVHRYATAVTNFRGGRYSYPPPELVPLEVGAEWPLEFMLPFVRDSIQVQGKGVTLPTLQECMRPGERVPPLLQVKPVAVVRVEARHFDLRRLDEWVYCIAEHLPLIWDGDDIARQTQAWLELNGLRMPRGGHELLSTGFHRHERFV